MNQDSWCTVERSSSQDWTRAERKHHKNTFESKVLKPDSNADSSTNRLHYFQVDGPNHKERRHFSSKCKL